MRIFKLIALLLVFSIILATIAMAGDSAGNSFQGESGGPGGMPGGPGGAGAAPAEYDAATEITEEVSIEGETFSSETGGENALHIYEGAKAFISNCEFTNGGEGSGGDAASFYGVGAKILVSEGTLYAWNCDIETTGGSSAAIRSDRGGGKMVVDGGKYVTQNGTGAVYCTADITVNNAYLYAGNIENAKVVGADGTVYVEGEGFTVTVGAFETTVDKEGAGIVPVWEEYAVENPFAE